MEYLNVSLESKSNLMKKGVFVQIMFYALPQELQNKILCYDPTKKESFNQVLHQIKMIPVFYQMKVKIEWFSTWQWQPNPWWFWFLKTNKGVRKKTTKGLLKFYLELMWKKHWNKTLCPTINRKK